MSGARIPDKHQFKIGEVARIADVKPHVLRYWESEFPAIRPQKSRTNQRLYARRDVELVLQIKDLLYREGFTIAGANKRLRELGRESPLEPSPSSVETIRHARAQVEQILALIEDDAPEG